MRYRFKQTVNAYKLGQPKPDWVQELVKNHQIQFDGDIVYLFQQNGPDLPDAEIGDWVIQFDDGTLLSLTDADFQARYTEVED